MKCLVFVDNMEADLSGGRGRKKLPAAGSRAPQLPQSAEGLDTEPLSISQALFLWVHLTFKLPHQGLTPFPLCWRAMAAPSAFPPFYLHRSVRRVAMRT